MLGFHSMSNFSVSLCGRHHSTQVPLCSTANVSLGMSELGVRDQQCSATGACGVNAWPPPVPHWGAGGGRGVAAYLITAQVTSVLPAWLLGSPDHLPHNLTRNGRLTHRRRSCHTENLGEGNFNLNIVAQMVAWI